MLRARDIALYFLNKEPSRFTDNFIEINGKTMREGNFRLNKYLHIAQNVYIAKTGELLFAEPLLAYVNGGIVKDVQANYIPIKMSANNPVAIPDDIALFLDKIANTLRGADNMDLLEISHQDPEWEEKNKAANQRMDSLSRVDEYREQYKDILTIMEMGLC